MGKVTSEQQNGKTPGRKWERQEAAVMQLHLEAAGEELQARGQIPAAVQPLQRLQALQAHVTVLLRRKNRMEM